jgi:hypothetical protein
LEHEDDETEPLIVHFNPNNFKGNTRDYHLADYELTADQLRQYAQQVINLRSAIVVKAEASSPLSFE